MKFQAAFDSEDEAQMETVGRVFEVKVFVQRHCVVQLCACAMKQ
jgi:hypothetical protein